MNNRQWIASALPSPDAPPEAPLRNFLASGIDVEDFDFLRAQVSRGERVIRDISVAKIGPAKGHGFDLDRRSLELIAELGNGTDDGIKSRLGHPGPDRDGVDWLLGRVRNFRVSGDRVIADLHVDPVAEISPRGDLSAYVMGRTESDPRSFGASVVTQGKKHPLTGRTLSPYRPEKFLAVDIVDDPAANPDGLTAI